MGTKESSAVVLEVFDAIERRDQKRIARLFHPSIELHWPPSLPYGGALRPSDRRAPTWEDTWIPLQPTEAERQLSPRVVAADENEVVVLWRQRGLSPRGEHLDTEVLGMYEVRNGKLLRAKMFYFDASAVTEFLAGAKASARRARAAVEKRPPLDMTLPPGQRRVDGFPRFGAHGRAPPPRVPDWPVILIDGGPVASSTVPIAELANLPRREVLADLHCVAGWSATALRWEGVPFAAFYEQRVQPSLKPGARVTHLVFEGIDGYRSVVRLDDACGEDVLIADRLGGAPLGGDHGAPARLVSPSQYGFISTKHLSRVTVYDHEPRIAYHRSRRANLALQLLMPHARARVWHEERHRYLPSWALRGLYRRLIPFFKGGR